MSASTIADVPPQVITLTSSMVQAGFAGEDVVIEVSETKVKGTDVDPKYTAVAPVKPVPVIVIGVPPAGGPTVALNKDTTGGDPPSV